MNTNIDFERMKEVFGDEIIDIISDNMDIIEENFETLKKLKFNDIIGLFERCPDAFMYFPNDFEKKMNHLIEDIGFNYIEVIENDVSYMENL